MPLIHKMVLNITLLGALDYLGYPADYAVGDFNNDGLLDVMFTGGSWDPEAGQPADRNNPIVVLTAQGGGSFSLETRPDLGSSVGAVYADVADFNGDGIDDVLIGFSESLENIALIGTAIENGIWLG